MADNDLINLYSRRILALASDIPHLGRLDDPDGTAKRRSPLCGSVVTVDLRLEDGKVSDFCQDVKACALGQAAAAVVGQNVLGASHAQILQARDQMSDMLKKDGPVPSAPFEGLEVLRPAADFTNRHASILLSLNATLDAFEDAAKRACA